MDTPEDILATITPSPARLWMAIAMLVALGVVLLGIGVRMPLDALFWQVLVLALAGLCIWMALQLYAVAGLRIELTKAGLRDSAGRDMARFEDITGVERGALAFKPSNGFLLRTKTPGPRVWVPGVWWRVGRSVGVGGVTPGHEAKAMADMIAIRLAMRDGG